MIVRGNTVGTPISPPAVARKITAEEVGAAPAGYGLGGYAQKVTDFNTVFGSGWYYGNNAANAPFHYSLVQVFSANESRAVQIGYDVSHNTSSRYAYGEIAVRRCTEGVWGEWECVNPSMIPGVEYRTTERWNGKAVYTQLVDFGACPLSSTKSLTVEIGEHRPTMIVDISGALFDPGDSYVNIDNASGVSVSYINWEDEIWDWDNPDESGNPTYETCGSIKLIVTTTNNYYQHYGVYFTLKYTKD